MNEFPTGNLSKNEGFFQNRLTEIFNTWVGTKNHEWKAYCLMYNAHFRSWFTFLCVYNGVMIGVEWYDKDDSFEWHINNYIVMEA